MGCILKQCYQMNGISRKTEFGKGKKDECEVLTNHKCKQIGNLPFETVARSKG